MVNHKILLTIALFIVGTSAWSNNIPASTPSQTPVSQDQESKNANSTVTPDKKLNSTGSTVIIENLPITDKNTPVTITINPPNPTVTSAVSQPVPVVQPMPEVKPSQPDIKPMNASNRIEIPPVPSLDIVVDKRFKNSPKLKRLYKLLGLKNEPNVIHLVANRNIASKKDSVIFIQPRSFLSMLDYLSNAVQVTPEIIKKNLVVVPRYPNGKYFDLTNITKGIFLVRISKTRPTCPTSVLVFYRGYWFYIADEDYKSKRTFAMLQQIFNLQAGETPGQNVPVLTIPAR